MSLRLLLSCRRKRMSPHSESIKESLNRLSFPAGNDIIVPCRLFVRFGREPVSVVQQRRGEGPRGEWKKGIRGRVPRVESDGKRV